MRPRSKVGAGLHTMFAAGWGPWRWVRCALGLFLVCIAVRPTSARAQQAIVTMPSADITDSGVAFAMKESQLRVWGPKPMWNATFFLTYGIGHHTELAATFFNIGVPATRNASLAVGESWATRFRPKTRTSRYPSRPWSARLASSSADVGRAGDHAGLPQSDPATKPSARCLADAPA